MPLNTIQINDQVGLQKQILELVVPSLQITARELIHLRVHHEFISARILFETSSQSAKETREELGDKAEKQFVWMNSLGKFNLDATWESEAEKVCQSYQNGQFIILAGGKQLGDLDEQFILDPENSVEFIRLVPLIGG